LKKKHKIEIWSDVMCPFCYIGKRRLEQALEQFEHRDEVEIEWKSFQLDPTTKSQPGKNVFQYLAERYGRDIEWSKETHKNVVQMAKEVGLEYNFDKAIIANSFDAHRVSHLAKEKNLGPEFEELLFKSYFTNGKNIADLETLVSLGVEVGLEENKIREVLNGSSFGNAVRQDIAEAQQIGVSGVPFFVFDRKRAISGAQPEEQFLSTLQEMYLDS